MDETRITWKIPFVLAVIWFAFGIYYQVRHDLSLLVVVICVVVVGSLIANRAYKWLQKSREHQAEKMEEFQIPRMRLVDALLGLSPQDVALLTARSTQKLARDVAVPGNVLSANRLAGQREWLRAVRQYVDRNSDDLTLWSDPAIPDSLRKTAEATDRIIGELQQHTDSSSYSASVPQGEVESYVEKLAKQGSAFEQLAGAA